MRGALGATLAAPACVILALAGCASPASTSSTSSLPESTLTSGVAPSSMLLTLSGVLTMEGECVVLAADAGQMTSGSVSLLWPRGSQLRREGPARVVVRPDGVARVQVGQRVTVAGGFVDPPSASSCIDSSKAFEVDDVIAAS